MSEVEPPVSLATRLRAGAGARLAAWRGRERSAAPVGEWRVGLAVAALIALGPLATILGANMLAGGARTEARLLQAKVAPRVAAEGANARARDELAAVLRRPGAGQVLEAVARVLPPEASLVRAERNGDGLIELEVSTPDPDKLRAALRREPLLSGLRDSGQRQGDAAMIVAFREAVE